MGGRPAGYDPVEVIDCGRHGPGSGAELFVVEGESAALAVARGRDPLVQAVLPMRGKPLNALKASRKRVESQPFFQALARTLGTGMGEAFDLRGLRYERVLLLTDPDADGIHCGVLLLGFLVQWMRPLVEAGGVGWVRAPWGEVTEPGGAPPRIARSEAELVALADSRGGPGGRSIRRFRGLAALGDDLLAVHCLDPDRRRVDRLDLTGVEGMLRAFAPPGPVGG